MQRSIILAVGVALAGCKTTQSTSEAAPEAAPAQEGAAPEEAAEVAAEQQPQLANAAASIPIELRTLYFAFDSATLEPEARKVLTAAAEALRQRPDVALTIVGHCDERGTVEYNLALGDRRARAVADFLVRLGVSSARIKTISFGEERPADSGDGESAWARNRRAEFEQSPIGLQAGR